MNGVNVLWMKDMLCSINEAQEYCRAGIGIGPHGIIGVRQYEMVSK